MNNVSIETSCVTDTKAGTVLYKPVFWHDTKVLNQKSGFADKRLCDGYTFTAGTGCAYSCRYCYAESFVFKQKAVRHILKQSCLPFDRIVIRRRRALQRLALELTKPRPVTAQVSAVGHLTPELVQNWGLAGKWSLVDRAPMFRGPAWQGKVIFGSPLVDVAATKELARETVDLSELVLRLTSFDIRLLSKSPLLESIVAKELTERLPDVETGAKARVIFGLSTGTLDDRVAAAIEPHAPSPSARLKALHWLQDNGFRTYGMLCPILPQRDQAAYEGFTAEAMRAIRAEQCEDIWAEAVNFRAGGKGNPQSEEERHQRDSFTATLQALRQGALAEQAELFNHVAHDDAAWEGYCRMLFEALVKATPLKTLDPIETAKAKAERSRKLCWLHYPRSYASIRDYWEKQEGNGALLLGGVMTRYLKPKKRDVEESSPVQMAATKVD